MFIILTARIYMYLWVIVLAPSQLRRKHTPLCTATEILVCTP